MAGNKGKLKLSPDIVILIKFRKGYFWGKESVLPLNKLQFLLSLKNNYYIYFFQK